MEDESTDKPLAEPVAQLAQPLVVAAGHAGGRLDLEASHSTVGRFENEVDLTARPVSEVTDLQALLGPGSLAAQLAGYEPLEQMTRCLGVGTKPAPTAETLSRRAASPVSSRDTFGRDTTRLVRLVDQAGTRWIR